MWPYAMTMSQSNPFFRQSEYHSPYRFQSTDRQIVISSALCVHLCIHHTVHSFLSCKISYRITTASLAQRQSDVI